MTPPATCDTVQALHGEVAMAYAKAAQPAMAIGATALSMVQPVKVAGQGGGDYRAPAGYQSPDLAAYCEPPASLGQFFPKV